MSSWWWMAAAGRRPRRKTSWVRCPVCGEPHRRASYAWDTVNGGVIAVIPCPTLPTGLTMGLPPL